MKALLEKTVEDELYNESIRAYFNRFGPFEAEAFGRQTQRMRQVYLEPYGIADLVHIVHADEQNPTITIQVIECKRDLINLATYAQAKRYLSALKAALGDFVSLAKELKYTIKWECILVGYRLDKASDFVFVLNDDAACSVYTYEQVEGKLLFTEVGKSWGYAHSAPHTAHITLEKRVKAEAFAAWDRAHADFVDYYSKYDKQGNPL